MLEGEEVVESGSVSFDLSFDLSSGFEEITALDELIADWFELGVFWVFILQDIDDIEGFIESSGAGKKIGKTEVGFGTEVVEFNGLAVGSFCLKGESAGVVKRGDGGAELREGFTGYDIADKTGVGTETLGIPVPEGGVVGDELGGDGSGLVVEFKDETMRC